MIDLKKELLKWKMSYREYKGIECEAPCSMYSVLLENNLIKDPFYGTNEHELTKYSDYPCEFECEFEVSEEEYKKQNINLIFHGLDTICDIYLNGAELGRAMDMHIRYSFSVKDKLKAGMNNIILKFSSPTEYFKYMHGRHYIFTNNEMNGDTIIGAGHLRKSFCMSGWDWGPKLPDMGIFRKVEIDCYDGAKIEDIFIYQNHSEDGVSLDISVAADGVCDSIYFYIDGKKYELENGKGHIEIENPKLWWPKGYGEQNLYDIKAEAVLEGKVTDICEKRIGLRTLYISTEEVKDGSEFCFVANGYKIFSMGANYVPIDSLVTRNSYERTRKLLESCVDANFNTVRVWGGAYYPDDYFYDICDELGLIVWQDFMVACCDIWLTDENEKLFKIEAEQNVKRIRHHASLGLLCGNNENEERVRRNNPEYNSVKADYFKLFERILPDICLKLAPQTFYWPSSPSNGGTDNPAAYNIGDTHYWEVWGESAPFENYRKKFRFCSEFGFESFPSVKTIKTFCGEEDMNPFSEIMENHQKHKGGNAKILSYLASEYLYPSRFEDLVYASQLLQAEAIKFGVEYFRRVRGYCMGSIYWQMNDCWPVASWSSLDYFGRYKALHYAAKKFYAPTLMALFLEDGEVTISVSNEKMKDISGKIRFGVYDNNFNAVTQEICGYSLKKLSAKDIITVDISEYEGRKDLFFAAEIFDENDNKIMQQTVLFVKPKHYKWQAPEIKAEFEKNGDMTEIYITSGVFAKSVEIDFEDFDVVLSDNYFDIIGADGVKISAKTDKSVGELENALRIKSVYDIR